MVADGAHAGEVVVGRHEYAADALHRFGDHCGHGFGPFADDRFLQIAGCGRADGFALVEVAFVAIRMGRVAVDEVGHQRAKHLVVAGDAGGASGGEGDAVIGLAAGDDLDLVGLPLAFPEIAGGLEGGVIGFGAAGGEKCRFEAGVSVAGEFVGQFAGGQVGHAGEVGGIGQLFHLGVGGLRQLGAAIADIHIPETGHGIEDLAAVGGVEPDAFGMLDNDGVVGLGRVVQRVNLPSILFEQGWLFLYCCHWFLLGQWLVTSGQWLGTAVSDHRPLSCFYALIY